MNTFAGHKWNVRMDNDVLLTWMVEDKPSQRFILSSEDLPIFS